MKTIILILLVVSCSHSPKSSSPSTSPEGGQVPKVMDGISVEKRVFYELQGANGLLRNKQDGTLAIWAKPREVVGSYQNLISISVGGQNEPWKSRASFMITPKGELQSSARAQDGEDKSEVTTRPGVVKANEWQHIALTINYAKKKMQFYLNGEKVPTSTEYYKFITPETSDTNSNRSALAAEDDGSGGYFTGELTGAYMGGGILSENEIKELMNKTRP